PALWGGLAHGLPQGQPRDGDRGLDHTPTWGRTYWGGAMFCLLADVEMRRRSAGRAGLQQALQGLGAAGGNYSVRWPVERVLAEPSGSPEAGLVEDAPSHAVADDHPHPVVVAAAPAVALHAGPLSPPAAQVRRVCGILRGCRPRSSLPTAARSPCASRGRPPTS